MTKEEIVKFINENPICYLGTVEGDTPHVRAVSVYKADKRGILIQVSTLKGMYQELVRNQKVELCFNGGGKMVRVSGTADFVEDQALKEEVVKARPFLKSMVDRYDLEVIKIFRVTNPMATVWTMATNLDPKEYIRI